jgi:hypothetical protein
MKTLKAIKGHSYGGLFRKPGDTYRALDSHANLMVLVKNSVYHEHEPVAAEPPAEAPKAKRPYTRKNLSANKPAGYSTKDMAAD